MAARTRREPLDAGGAHRERQAILHPTQVVAEAGDRVGEGVGVDDPVGETELVLERVAVGGTGRGTGR